MGAEIGSGHASVPLPSSQTFDLHIEYVYQGQACTAPVSLSNVRMTSW